MKLPNFQVEIPNLKGSNSTIKIGFPNSFLYKPFESTLVQIASILGWAMYEIGSYHYSTVFKNNIWFFLNLKKSSKITTKNGAKTNKFKFSDT
jgi:hypothetical protein